MAPEIAPHSPQPHYLNVFEGPEKKLLITFNSASNFIGNEPDHLSTYSSHIDEHLVPRRSLRMLSRSQVQSILDAAACTILSVTSNEYCDAYLLSESSLFVSDKQLMMKTCGTTTLLHALPIILKITYECMGFCAITVQFSRVSYIFPQAQLFPHDSFDNEVMFLDEHLRTLGQVMETSDKHGSRWHLYHAAINTPLIKPDWIPQPNARCFVKPGSYIANTNLETLEIFMFDLDPAIMGQFMFHDRQQMIGSDDPKHGTSVAVGISDLLPASAVVDAFNFEPCGYSMNALFGANFCTIHVSPEPDASYVSFETNIPSDSIPKLVNAVVQTFKPSRFKVALTRSTIDESPTGSTTSTASWKHITALLHAHGYEGSQLPGSELLNCIATVASYSINPSRLVSKNISTRGSMNLLSEPKDHLREIANLYNASPTVAFSWIENFQSRVATDKPSKVPFFLIDLSRIFDNVTKLQKLTSTSDTQLRYALRCNCNEAIVALLNRMKVVFEVCSVKEIELLKRLGVPKEHIVLTTPSLTPDLVAKLALVGMVTLFDSPDESVLRAIEEHEVAVEVQVITVDRDEIETKMCKIINSVKQIAAIAIDIKRPPELKHKCTTKGMVDLYADTITRCLSMLPDELKETVKISVGESFCSDLDTKNASFLKNLDYNLKSYLPHRRGGIEVSRLLVSNSVFLLTQVIGRRYREVLTDGHKQGTYHYYLNDGVYGALSCVVMDRSPDTKKRVMKPQTLKKCTEDTECVLFGPTCDALDCIWVGKLPMLDVDDWVLFEDMGAYSESMVCGFNGFGTKYDVHYVAHCA